MRISHLASAAIELVADSQRRALLPTGGKLTCCDMCPRVYHMRCLPPAALAALKRQSGADEDWWCPFCLKMLRLTFCMYRMVSSAASSDAHRADVEQQLYQFVADDRHEGSWEEIRTAAHSLNFLALLPHWQEGDQVSLSAEVSAWQELPPVQPLWWDDAFAVAPEPPPAPVVTANGHAKPNGHSKSKSGSKSASKFGSPAIAEDKSANGHAPPAAPSPTSAEDASSAGSRRTSEFRGVSRRYGRWKARIKLHGHDIVIGDFDDEVSAAQVPFVPLWLPAVGCRPAPTAAAPRAPFARSAPGRCSQRGRRVLSSGVRSQGAGTPWGARQPQLPSQIAALGCLENAAVPKVRRRGTEQHRRPDSPPRLGWKPSGSRSKYP